MNLAEEIQRVKSKDSPARGTTYILLEDRAARKRMGTMYNGGGLGQKGAGVCRRFLAGFKGL